MLIKCEDCQKEMSSDVKICPSCGKDRRNWIMKHKLISFIGGFILLIIVMPFLSKGDRAPASTNIDSVVTTTTPMPSETKVVLDTTTPSGTPIPTEIPKPTIAPTPTEISKPIIPTEYKSALTKAYFYADNMNMSKKGVYEQLTSEYGEKFSKKAAQYAIDNIETNWKAHALAKAKFYQDKMSMSPSATRDQLTSEYGEKFTQAEADYAIQHIND